MIGNRLEVEAGASGPITQRDAIQRNPLSGVDLGLPIKRQMIAKLRDDHLGDQRLGRQPARHDMLGSMRLRHGARAATARIFRATGHQHLELRRDHIETLGDVFADHRHRTASARTHRADRFNQPLHGRQVSGQLAAVANARTIRASRLSADDRLGFFLRGMEIWRLRDFEGAALIATSGKLNVGDKNRAPNCLPIRSTNKGFRVAASEHELIDGHTAIALTPEQRAQSNGGRSEYA